MVNRTLSIARLRINNMNNSHHEHRKDARRNQLMNASLCPPRGWSRTRVGVGMLRGRGIPLLENRKVSKFRSFNVLKLQSLNISKFQPFTISKASKCHSFTISKFQISKTKLPHFNMCGDTQFQCLKIPNLTFPKNIF